MSPNRVRLRVSTVTSVSHPRPAGTAPQYRGRDRIRTLPKMVSKPVPERYVELIGQDLLSRHEDQPVY
jgi:hypothetical protein